MEVNRSLWTQRDKHFPLFLVTNTLLTFTQVLLNSQQLLVVRYFLHQWMLKRQLPGDSPGVCVM